MSEGDLPGSSLELPILDENAVREQLLHFARDLSRLYRKERTRAEELSSALKDLEESYLATVQAMAFIVEAKDEGTHAHLRRAHDYAVALAERLAPEMAADNVFRFGFLLHDIGKVGIPEYILRKPSALTTDERQVMQTHPIIGAQILAPIKFLARAVPIVECHHEQWDGGGYPRGLKGEEIPLPARIFFVVDTFDAMTSDRPYRRALSVDHAVAEILGSAGKQFDPDIAKEFATLCSERTSSWPLERAPYIEPPASDAR